MNETPTPARRALRICGNVVGILLIVVLLPVVTINLTLIIRGFVRPNEVPTFFGVAALLVESGSMQPEIMVDDLILTRRVDAEDLQEQDIIAFQLIGSTNVVTHRIVEVVVEDGELQFITAGDYTGVPDDMPVIPEQIVGLYFQRFANVGRAADFLQQPIGMVVFVAIPLALFLVYDLLRRHLYNKKKAQQDDGEKAELERLCALAAAVERGETSPAEQPAPPAPEPEPVTQMPPESDDDFNDDESES